MILGEFLPDESSNSPTDSDLGRPRFLVGAFGVGGAGCGLGGEPLSSESILNPPSLGV